MGKNWIIFFIFGINVLPPINIIFDISFFLLLKLLFSKKYCNFCLNLANKLLHNLSNSFLVISILILFEGWYSSSIIFDLSEEDNLILAFSQALFYLILCGKFFSNDESFKHFFINI